MENAVEALKIAGAVLMFVLALTLGISSLSKANNTVDSVVRMRDKDTLTEYEIVKPSKDLTRNVGAETIVATMYRAYEEDIEIYFKNADGTDLPIYYKTDSSGNKKIDSNGNIDGGNRTLLCNVSEWKSAAALEFGNFSGIGCKWWICYHIFLRSFRIHVDEALL